MAIKIFDKNALDVEKQVRLRREIDSMKRLKHPNIIRLYEVIKKKPISLLLSKSSSIEDGLLATNFGLRFFSCLLNSRIKNFNFFSLFYTHDSLLSLRIINKVKLVKFNALVILTFFSLFLSSFFLFQFKDLIE